MEPQRPSPTCGSTGIAWGAMANPIGYLYRVGQSRPRRRRPPALPSPEAIGLPDVEPALIPALLRLPETQRVAVWLVHACQWRYGEVAEALNTTTSMVGNHVSRGLAAFASNWRCTQVLDIGDQLRRYGEALERHLGEGGDRQVVTAAPARRRSQLWLVAAAVLVIALGSATFIVTRLDGDDAVVSTTPDSGDARTGVFSTPTDTVLLFSDGIDGATAIDLDRRIAGRRVIEGERAGDQSFRLTLTGDHLVVGWGEIYAAPLAGGASRKIADATIYVPASEPGEVWTLAWEGGRIGAGAATLQRVTVDGTVTFTSSEFDASVMHPVMGVPGGIAVDTPNGVAVWDADTGRTGPVLGPGPATAASSTCMSSRWLALAHRPPSTSRRGISSSL